VHVRVAVKTTNPNNGAQGWSKNAAFAKARRRKAERAKARDSVAFTISAHCWHEDAPWRVFVTRVAPSQGLDPHDGLGAALKGCIDGVADALGLKNDRDPRVTWIIGQRQGPRGFYAVDIIIESVAAKEVSA
jgi:hypothetical protein